MGALESTHLGDHVVGYLASAALLEHDIMTNDEIAQSAVVSIEMAA